MTTKISADLNMIRLENKTREYRPYLFNILSCFLAKMQRKSVIWPFFNTCTQEPHLPYFHDAILFKAGYFHVNATFNDFKTKKYNVCC